MSEHLRKFEEVYRRPLPLNYICFDLETTGFKPVWDLPVQIAILEVAGGKPRKPRSEFLDWTRHPKIDQSWLRYKLHTVGEAMRKKGHHRYVTYEQLRDTGIDPAEVITDCCKFFRRSRQNGISFVGHNAWGFDAKMLEGCAEAYGGDDFLFGDNDIYDSGCMEKAAYLGMSPNPGETLRAYFHRVRYAYAENFKWGLEVCATRYGFIKSAELAANELHDAEADCLMCHRIFEQHRALLEVTA